MGASMGSGRRALAVLEASRKQHEARRAYSEWSEAMPPVQHAHEAARAAHEQVKGAHDTTASEVKRLETRKRELSGGVLAAEGDEEGEEGTAGEHAAAARRNKRQRTH